MYDKASNDEKEVIEQVVRHKAVNARAKPWLWSPKSIKQSDEFFGIVPAAGSQ